MTSPDDGGEDAPPGAPGWRPTASARTLALRAYCLAGIRRFFRERAVLEVETPVLSAAGATDPNIPSFVVEAATGEAAPRLLGTSPEFHLKRLLAAGVGDCYSLGRVFRAGEAGRRHNPEFTLLEWYRLGMDHHGLMDEVVELLGRLSGDRETGPVETLSYAEAMHRHTGVDPHRASEVELRAALEAYGVPAPVGEARDELLDLLMGAVVGPRLGHGEACFVHDYPASQAALARVRAGGPGQPDLAERFELYLGGLEIANGFHELTDPVEQRRRFEDDRRRRRAAGLPEVPVDEHLLAALEHGLPDCSGVAFGVDRFLMWRLGVDDIREVVAFPWERA